MAPRIGDSCFLCGRSQHNNDMEGIFTLFCLPKNNIINANRRKIWLASIKTFMPEGWVVPEKDFKICAAHFQPVDLYESSGRLFMYTSKGKPYAKPEIFVAPITPKKDSDTRQPLQTIVSNNSDASCSHLSSRKRRIDPVKSQVPKMSKAATIFILPSPPVLEQNEHVVLVDCNFSDNSLVDDQSNVLNALELRTKILEARAEKDFRMSMNTLTPARRYLGRSLVHKEEILLTWASKQNDDNPVDNVTFFIFNEVREMREALGAITEKNKNISELQKKISELSREDAKAKNLKFSSMETELKAAKRNLFSGE